ncbi:MAG: antibiotic biosynthesis monooxygenase [Maribacter sp.]|nr:antibiotic biosynthesis monooxygenase [Maribacter sp.]MBT8313780.1 antibiotic biosynthesis monooxygenase [Maribacter sp.]
MLIRIVKLTFETRSVAKFEQFFKESKQYILNFEGCNSLELLQDKTNANIFFTYSEWENEEYLNKYRNSDFFKNVWGKTRVLFNEKPEVWSVYKKNFVD